MEVPYNGRATIIEHFDKIEITVSPKKKLLFILFFGFWLFGWFFAEKSAISEVTKAGISDFTFIWFIIWTVGGLFAMYSLWVMFAAKEFIEAGQGVISIKNRALFFMPEKVYDLREVKNLRIEQPEEDDDFSFGRRQRIKLDLTNVGTIRFDYGMKTIKFGNGIDEAEAKYIVDKLKSKRILLDQNF
jgi:hypothetical protein